MTTAQQQLSTESFHGDIKEDASVCWFSFPGKYAAGWDALTKLYRHESVACVFLCSPEDGGGPRTARSNGVERCGKKDPRVLREP